MKKTASEAILAFEETSKRLYESAGSMNVDPTSNGPQFLFSMQGDRSKGIKNVQILLLRHDAHAPLCQARYWTRFPCPRQSAC